MVVENPAFESGSGDADGGVGGELTGDELLEFGGFEPKSVDAEELWVAFVEGGHSGEGVAAFGDAQVEGAFGFGELLLFESQSVGFRVWEFWEGSL